MAIHGPEQLIEPPEQSDQLAECKLMFDRTREGDLCRQSESSDDKLSEFIQEYKNPEGRIVFERDLASSGWLMRLEQVGILPVLENPNPFDPEMEEQQHEQWWEEYPNEEEQYGRNVERREDILKYLYVGTLLGRHLRESS